MWAGQWVCGRVGGARQLLRWAGLWGWVGGFVGGSVGLRASGQVSVRQSRRRAPAHMLAIMRAHTRMHSPTCRRFWYRLSRGRGPQLIGISRSRRSIGRRTQSGGGWVGGWAEWAVWVGGWVGGVGGRVQAQARGGGAQRISRCMQSKACAAHRGRADPSARQAAAAAAARASSGCTHWGGGEGRRGVVRGREGAPRPRQRPKRRCVYVLRGGEGGAHQMGKGPSPCQAGPVAMSSASISS